MLKHGKRPRAWRCTSRCNRRAHARFREFANALEAALRAAEVILDMPESADDRTAMELAELRAEAVGVEYVTVRALAALESYLLPCCHGDDEAERRATA